MSPSANPESHLSSRTLFRFFLPLALSWLFMGLDGPISVGVISRLADPKVNTAAFLALMSISLWIESPVIDLLSTATTLGKDKQSFQTLQKFVFYVNLWVTAIHALVILSPLYHFLTDHVIAMAPEVANAARPGLVVMIPWSLLIGWRRYRQGILIRNGQTRIIGLGTALRVSVMALTAIGLGHFAPLPSIVVVAMALVTSVGAEALFIHFVSEPIIKDKVFTALPQAQPLSLKRLAKFHFPLTATTMTKLLTGLILGAGLARTANGTQAMAAFQVATTIIFLFRAFGFCLPEVVIALYNSDQSRAKLHQFCLGVGFCTTAGMLLLSISGLDGLVFERILGASPSLVPVARATFVAVSLAPFLDAAQAYVRGILTAHHLTVSRMFAVAISTTVLISTVILAVRLGWSGPALAGFSMTLSLGAEYAVLAVSLAKAPRMLSAQATSGS